jgi:hypothetical protein
MSFAESFVSQILMHNVVACLTFVDPYLGKVARRAPTPAAGS